MGHVSKLGIQWQDAGCDDIIRFNQLMHPLAMKSIMGGDKVELWTRLIADNPDLRYRIYRHYPNYDYLGNPEGLAKRAIEELGAEIAPIKHLLTHVEDVNEEVHSFHTDRFHEADIFMSTFARLSKSQLGLRAISGNFACGHHGDDIAKDFPLTCEALIETGGAWGTHEYDWPTMRRLHDEDIKRGGEGMFLCLKWRRMMRSMRAKYGDAAPKVFVTECGLDGGVAGKHTVGWRGLNPGALWLAMDSYLSDQHSLGWYVREANADPDVLALILFGCGMGGDWGLFDIKAPPVEIINRMRFFPTIELPEPEPAPGPVPEEGDMDIRVIDLNYKERDFEYIKEKYGIAYRRAKVPRGQPVFRLIEVWEKTGTTALITQVLGMDGLPIAQSKDVAFYWPDAPLPPDPPTVLLPHDWHDRFIHALTEGADQEIGPSMGKGAYHGRGEGGPHAVWVRDPNIPSDIAEKLGMLAGTFHDHCDLKFKLMIAGEDDELPEGKWYADESTRRFGSTEGDNYIAIEIASGEMNFFGIRAHLIVAEDPEHPLWEAKDPFAPLDNLAAFFIQANYVPVGEEQKRTFWVILRAADGTPVSDPIPFEFLTNISRVWTIGLTWETEGPPPEPEPEPGPEPEPEPEPTPGGAEWEMSIERLPAPGLMLIIGVLPRAGIDITIDAEELEPISLKSGSKPEYGAGGFEVALWHPGTYFIMFDDQEFEVAIGHGECVRARFAEKEVMAEARITSLWLPISDALEVLQELDDEGFGGIFALEER